MRRKPARTPVRRGVIAVMVGVCLVGLLGIVALVLEGGHMLDKRRQAQTAADSAAYAAALELLSSGGTSREAVARAKASALSLASGNGFANDGTKSIVTVNMPPGSGSAAGKDGYVEVVVEYRHSRSFSRLMGAGPVRIQARSVAAGTFLPTKASVLILDGKGKGSLHLSKGTLQTAGDVFVNSRSKDAVHVHKNSQLIADSVIVSGGVKKDFRRRISGEITQQVPATPDPLASLAEPDAGPSRKASDFVTVKNGQELYALQPGEYGDLKFNSNDLVTMAPGTYHLNGEFQFKDKSSLSAQEVLLVNLKKDMKFETHGSIEITPQKSGTYEGISIFQPPSVKKKVAFKNDGSYDIRGTIYVPNGEVKFQKVDMTLGGFLDGDSDDEDEAEDDSAAFDAADDELGTYASLQAQIIARKLKLDGKTTLNIGGNGIDASKPYLMIVE